MSRTLFMSAALTFLASVAGAQVTTYVPAQRPLVSREAVAAVDSVRRDSVAEATMANMKAWVDSAAGVDVPVYVGRVDSAALANDPGRPVSTFSDGSVAPATASELPALVAVGVLVLALGALLLATRARG